MSRICGFRFGIPRTRHRPPLCFTGELNQRVQHERETEANENQEKPHGYERRSHLIPVSLFYGPDRCPQSWNDAIRALRKSQQVDKEFIRTDWVPKSS